MKFVANWASFDVLPRVTYVNYAGFRCGACTVFPKDTIVGVAAMPKSVDPGSGRAAALRRFPADRKAIDELMFRNGDFRDMCDELAEAEDALRAVDGLPPSLRAERTAEWAASIELLAFEIARALKEANLVRVDRAIDPRRPQ